MHNKILKIIIAVFVVLAIITTFPWLNEKIGKQKNEKQTEISIDLSSFTKESVNKIVIKKGDSEKVLSFKDNKWYIGEAEADEEKINQLFQDFSQIKIKEMVSENENNRANFEVDQNTGIKLVLSKNGTDSIFFVGKADTAAGGYYMRKDGIKNVYLVSGNLRDKLTWEEVKWKKESAEEKKVEDKSI